MKHHVVTLLCSLLVLTACSDVNLLRPTDPISNAKSVGEFCTLEPEKRDVKTNILLVIDFSGSNATTTDPDRLRIKKTEEFYNNNKNPDLYRWSFISFESKAEAQLNDGDKNMPIFTEDDARVQETLGALKGFPQNGGTNYQAALDMSEDAIQNDIDTHPESDDYYLIIFMSDGEPNQGNITSEGKARQRVSELVGLKPGRIFLSAAYYFKDGSNSGARKIIEGMAEAGGGNFADFNNADDIEFDDLLVGRVILSWVLKNDSFLVYNLNSAICEDGAYDVDSDGDFLCDKDEIKYGFDPTKRSTPKWNSETGNYVDRGFADYFQWWELQGFVVLPPICELKDRIDEDNDLLYNCEEDLIKNDHPRGTEFPKDVIRYISDRQDPDTDNDGVIDGLELAVFRNHWGWGLDDFINKDWDGERISAFKQIQEHRNPLLMDPNAPKYDTLIQQQQSPGNGMSCYSYAQSYLQLHPTLPVDPQNVHPLLRNENNLKGGYNTVLVYFMQNRFKDPNGKGIYMYSFQSLLNDPRVQDSNGTAAGLKVNDTMFKPYETYRKLEARQ